MPPTLAPAPLSLKPDLADVDRRWQAFFAGDIIDRPIVCVTAPKVGVTGVRGSDYGERAFGDMRDIIERSLQSAEATCWLGESVPTFWTSFGPDEIGVFCGAELNWSDSSGDTNWSVPCIEDWDMDGPIDLIADHPLWQRMLDFYGRAADRLAGKMLIAPLDLHTNMDLLSAMRGPQRLCVDLVERPEAIERAMEQARAVFPKVWNAICEAGRMYEHGHSNLMYSMEGAAVLQCDFSGLIGPAMFRRWVLPALEEEAEIVKHVVYHWDGPGALVHTDDLIGSRGLHTLSYVPGDGRGSHIDYLDLFRRVQAGGKAVQVIGSPDQLKTMHRELRPEKSLYCTWAASEGEAEALLDWFVRNT